MKIIDKVEQLRLKGKVKKTDLCKMAGISLAMYYNYIKGMSMPYDTAERLISALGYKMAIIAEM